MGGECSMIRNILNVYRCLLESLKERRHAEYQDVDGRLILK